MFFRNGLPLFFLSPEDAGAGAPPPQQQATGGKDAAAELAEWKSKYNKLKSEAGRMRKQLISGEGQGSGNRNENKDKNDNRSPIRKTVDDERDLQRQRDNESREIEAAVAYNYGVRSFIEDNEDLLPSDVKDLIRVAETQNYDNQGQKSRAFKREIMQSFFQVAENRDYLTQYQKQQLEEFEGLTLNGKEAKVEALYSTVFEPALETLRRVTKAQEVERGRRGFSKGTSAQQKYEDNITKLSRKRYLNEKE